MRPRQSARRTRRKGVTDMSKRRRYHTGSRLTFTGADLTMMVFSWAQLGYLVIHLDDNGRVMLHKRMDMGNERSSFGWWTVRASSMPGCAAKWRARCPDSGA